MSDTERDAEDLMQSTSEPVVVEWEGGLGDQQTVKVDPYAGPITVNGREFDIGTLSSDDLPDWVIESTGGASA